MERSKCSSRFPRKAFLKSALLIEVMFAIALFSVVGSSIAILVTSLLSDMTFTKDSLHAQMMAEEGLEV